MKTSCSVWPKATLCAFLICFSGLPLRAAEPAAKAITAPGQQTSGPGGSTYPYASLKSFGPFYANGSSDPSAEFIIFQPSTTKTSSFPVVLFLHGYLLNKESASLGDQPVNYQRWINQIVLMGYTVVYPFYDDDDSSTWTSWILTDWSAALTMLNARQNGLIPPSSDNSGVQTLFAGHSMGAYQSFAVAQYLFMNPMANVPAPRAIAAMNPGLGESGYFTVDFTAIAPTTSVVLVKSDEEESSELTAADQIWNFLETQIPASQRDYLMVVTDEHGTPAQLGNHCWPLTNGLDDDTTVDDRDFRVSYKLTVGLFDCALTATNCSFGLGHGGSNQVSMGKWSDGTPVTPLLWNPPASPAN